MREGRHFVLATEATRRNYYVCKKTWLCARTVASPRESPVQMTNKTVIYAPSGQCGLLATTERDFLQLLCLQAASSGVPITAESIQVIQDK